MKLKQNSVAEKPESNEYDAESYTGIYSMHKYWSKKPFNIVRDFILRYTLKEDEIVVDPFCGSGISITESIYTRRKAVGIDINPSAIFITKQMLSKVSVEKLEEGFRKLELECKDKINSYYLVKRDNKSFIGTHFLWENGKLTEVWYNKGNGRRDAVIESPTEEDLKLAYSFSYDKNLFYYPKRKFFQNSRINANREQHIYELFTPRNLMALSFLLDEIGKIENEDIREMLKFCFTSAVGQASRMVFVIKKRGKFNEQARKAKKKEVGSWVIGYWVPKENFEINVWKCFEHRYEKIFKAKKEQEKLKYEIDYAKDFEELTSLNKNLLLVNDSAIRVLEKIPDNSVDYVITDPPHGNRLPYLELSMMWNEWLRKDVNYEDEIVISDSPDRKKDIYNYKILLNEVIKNVERILKPDRNFSLMFNSLDDETWINLVMFTNELCFDLEKIEILSYSATSVVQDNRGAGLKTDFILTFRKNPYRTKKEIHLYDLKQHQEIFTQMIDDFITNSQKGLQIYEIMNKLTVSLLEQKKFFKLSEVLNLIKKRYLKKGNKLIIQS